MIYERNCMKGKRILITGGGTGIGRGVAEHLASYGADVHIWGRRAEVLQNAAEEINARGSGRVLWQVVDVRDAGMVERAVSELWEEHGPLTGLVNNAAANFIAQTKNLSVNGYRAIVSTVMDGSYYTTSEVGRRWIAESRPGAVVSMLVTWIWSGSAYVVPSAMAKAAVHVMTMSLAVEWAQYNVRLNGIAAGPFPTEYAWKVLSPTDDVTFGATDAQGVPMRRHGRLPELANLVLFLLSDACDYLTGETITIDGGQHLAGPSTFANLTRLSEEQWKRIEEETRAATKESKRGRAT